MKSFLNKALPSERTARILDIFALFFITANIVLLIPNLLYCGKLTTLIAIGAPILFCLAVFTSLISLENIMVAFVFIFPLFGFQPYDRHSQAFQYMAALAAFSMHVTRRSTDCRQSLTPINGYLADLMVCYIALSLFSLLILPIGLIAKNFILMEFNFTSMLYAVSPRVFYYSITGVDRLMLFSIFAYEFAMHSRIVKHSRTIFLALFWAAVYSAVFGLLDYYNVLSLTLYRVVDTPGRVNAFFANRGWFAHYVNIAVPFVLLAFIRKGRDIASTVILFTVLIVVEVALFLAGARAGWGTYPVVLYVCWLAFISLRKGRYSFAFSTIIKAALLMPITIAVSIMFILFLSPKIEEIGSTSGSVQQHVKQQPMITEIEGKASYLYSHANNTARRTTIWYDGLRVAMESPIVGLGYDSYGWQATNLNSIAQSDYKKGTIFGPLDTPHNTFIQTFVSGGIIGLILWCSLIAYTIAICFADAVKNKNFMSLAVAISLVSAHIHGIFQDLQYIPMIWAVIFLEIGYAMTLEATLLPKRLNNFLGKFIICALIVTTAAIPMYLHLSSYNFIRNKYGVKTYMPDENQHRYGFYLGEIVEGSRYWYSGADAVIYVQGDNVEIPLICPHLDADIKPIVATITLDGNPIDKIEFSKPGKLTRSYYVGAGTHRLGIKISRLWNPIMAKASQDLRNIGLAVGEVRSWK